MVDTLITNSGNARGSLDTKRIKLDWRLEETQTVVHGGKKEGNTRDKLLVEWMLILANNQHAGAAIAKEDFLRVPQMWSMPACSTEREVVLVLKIQHSRPSWSVLIRYLLWKKSRMWICAV